MHHLRSFFKVLCERSGVFHLGYYVGHHAKRFDVKGGVKTILFYIYVLGNLFPVLKLFMRHIEWWSGQVFKERIDLKLEDKKRLRF